MPLKCNVYFAEPIGNPLGSRKVAEALGVRPDATLYLFGTARTRADFRKLVKQCLGEVDNCDPIRREKGLVWQRLKARDLVDEEHREVYAMAYEHRSPVARLERGGGPPTIIAESYKSEVFRFDYRAPSEKRPDPSILTEDKR